MTHPPPLASAKGKKPTGDSARRTPHSAPPESGLYVYGIVPTVSGFELQVPGTPNPVGEGLSLDRLGTVPRHARDGEQGRTMSKVEPCPLPSFGSPQRGSPTARNSKVETVCCGSLSALVSDVPLDEFSRETLAAHQDDLPWLEERVKRHHEVIRAAMTHTTILPMRFGTIFISHQALLEFLKENEPLFTRLLENFQGRQEWGAKLFHHSPPQFQVASCASRGPETRNSKPETAPSGRDYLLRKRRQRLARQKGETEAIAKAAELHHSLSRHAVSSRVHNSTVAPQEASEPTLVFSASYLVDAASLPSFVKAAEEFAASASPHFQATVSGPWPPYSFVSVQDISTSLQQQPADPNDSSDAPLTDWEVKHA